MAIGSMNGPRAVVGMSDRIGKRAVGVEDLDAVGISVGHGHDPAGAEGDALGPIELAGAEHDIVHAAVLIV